MSVVAADAHADLVESLDQRVREAVRREGVDPQRDAIVVRRLAEAVVRAHDERSLTGVVAPVSDVDSMVGELVARVSGFGPLQQLLEGLSRGWTAVNIRKFVLTASRIHDLVELGTLTKPAATFLEASVRAGLNILVAGGTQAGKTTLLNCLAAAIPGGDRVVSAEEV